MQSETPSPPSFTVKLLPDDLIFVERRSEQAERDLEALFAHTDEITKYLREQGKPVLVLNHARLSHVSPRVWELIVRADFDRLAIYGASVRLQSIIELTARANALEQKIVCFHSRDEAINWLKDFRANPRS